MPQPLYYTFGNHMHWVDMEWLWGYHVLPGSVRDMIRLCREAGVKGCVNFDAVGYEKLAVEEPSAFAELREAIGQGLIEPVGCSYGQPYGLFHGGESNVRHLIYGARTVRRLLDVWPETFWEEEFYFFPQLPQMLVGCGFTGASLFFQWTWHTPEIPREAEPVVWWEGVDGSGLLAATRNALNLHQWPEDMDIVLSQIASGELADGALIQQWLELMPYPDWMCRSELILPKLRELMADERFDIRPVTLGEYLRASGLGVSPRIGTTQTRSIGVPPMVSSGVSPEYEATESSHGTNESRAAPGGLGVSPKVGTTQARSIGVSPMVSSGVSPEPVRADLDEPGIIKRQGGRLPHWTRDRATYAVTFRLADALPKDVQASYAADREELRRLHENGKLSSRSLAYEYLRLRSEKIEGYLDAGHGSCLLKDPEVARLVSQALIHFDGTRYELIASVVMPNHVHVVVRPNSGVKLDGIVHSWKSFTSHEINKLKAKGGINWQVESYDHLIRDEQDLANQVHYVESNPVKAGMPDWPWLYVREDRGRYEYAQLGQGRDAPVNHRRAADGTRCYQMHDVWHGLTLGRNGDRARRDSRQIEERIRTFEALFSVLALLGRPYLNWDVYPTWELEESWRKLLRSQHHDIDECEGLCAYPAEADRAWIWKLAEEWHAKVRNRPREGYSLQAFNPNGWEVDGCPAFTWGLVNRSPRPALTLDENVATISCPGGFAKVDLRQGMLIHLSESPDAANVLDAPTPLWPRWYEEDGSIGVPTDIVCSVGHAIDVRCNVRGTPCQTSLLASKDRKGLQVFVHLQMTPKIPGGYRGSYRMFFPCSASEGLITDTPYAVTPLTGYSKGVRKYPEGDWMTSPQWFEDVENTFFASSLVDLPLGGRRMLVCQDAPKQWFKVDGGYEAVVASYDPWDEDNFDHEVTVTFDLVPHNGMSFSALWKTSNQVPPLYASAPEPLPAPILCLSENVVVTALYRETEESGMHLRDYAGRGMGYPCVVRLVEFDGCPTEVTVRVLGPLASAFKTDLLGQIEGHFDLGEIQDGYHTLTFPMRPREIATMYLDLVPGRKQTRDLDAKREIWATVHRTGE